MTLERRPLPAYVIHWRSPQTLDATLRALAAQTVPVEPFIVDNASPPDTVARLRTMGVPFESLPTNVGYGGAVNWAFRKWLEHDDRPFIVLCPHDALPNPDCLERILDAMQTRPRAGIGSAEYGDDSTPGYTTLRGYGSYPTVRGDGWCPAEFPNGTFFVVARECVEEIGGFDDRYFTYGDEYGFGNRALRARWDVGQVWGAVVHNPARAASSDLTWYLNLRNSLLASHQREGFSAALVRTLAMSAVGLSRAMTAGPTDDGPSSAVRYRAIRDFWLGRFGRPKDILR